MEYVNGGFLSSKHRTQCPFLSRRGSCVKGNQCDFSNETPPNNVQGRSDSSVDRQIICSVAISTTKRHFFEGLKAKFYSTNLVATVNKRQPIENAVLTSPE